MFRSVYRQIKRLLARLGGGGPSVKEAENHRRDVETRYGGGGDYHG